MNAMRGIIAGSVVVLMLAGAGCSDKNSVPSGILSLEQMHGVMWDMIQADQYSALYLAKDSAHIDLKLENLRLYEQVLRLHQVSREEFRKSYQYYLDHPAINQVLFDSVASRGIRERTESYSRSLPFHPPPPQTGQGAHNPVLPFRSPGAPVKFPPSRPNARDSAAKYILHPGKKDSVRHHS